jgi:hypothetical protein
LHLHLALQRAAQLQLRAWQPALMQRFGPEVGTKLSQHQVEGGMTLDMVLASMGTPTQVQDLSADGPNLYLRYRGVEMGSLTELHHGILTRASVGRAAFPEHFYD